MRREQPEGNSQARLTRSLPGDRHEGYFFFFAVFFLAAFFLVAPFFAAAFFFFATVLLLKSVVVTFHRSSLENTLEA